MILQFLIWINQITACYPFSGWTICFIDLLIDSNVYKWLVSSQWTFEPWLHSFIWCSECGASSFNAVYLYFKIIVIVHNSLLFFFSLLRDVDQLAIILTNELFSFKTYCVVETSFWLHSSNWCDFLTFDCIPVIGVTFRLLTASQ